MPHPTKLFHADRIRRCGHLLLALASALICLGALLWLPQTSAVHAQSGPTQEAVSAADPCQQVTGATSEECRSLVALYAATHGAAWKNNNRWLDFSQPDAPCSWFGVSCSNGHVISLQLSANRLEGNVPALIGALTALQTMNLANNALEGRPPHALCKLADAGVAAILDYNKLAPPPPATAACLERLAPGWLNTQTAPPQGIAATSLTTDSIELLWTPIAYTGDGGNYAIGVAEGITGAFTLHGVTTDKTESTYRIDGLQSGRTYRIQVRSFTPAHDQQPRPLVSNPASLQVVTESSQRTLVAVYFAADNDLSPYAAPILLRLRKGTLANPNVHVIYLADRAGDHNTRIFEISRGVITATTMVSETWGTDELDTADPDILAWFLQSARAAFPAERTIVSLIGHGVGLTPEYTWPAAAETTAAANAGDELPPLPREKEATATDLTNGSFMSTVDWGAALAKATNNGEQPFDIVFFDQCFQGSFDALYEMRASASTFVVSPNYAWLAAPYDRYLAALAPTLSIAESAEAIIRIYQNQLDDTHPNSIFWITRSQINNTAVAVSHLADALLAALQGKEAAAIAQAVPTSKFVDTNQCGERNFHLGPPDEMLGAATFARRLQESFGAVDAFGVSAAAAELLAVLDTVHKTVRTGHPHIAPDELWDYDDVLTLLAPLRRDAAARTVWRASLYRDDTPLQAIWSPSPTTTVTISPALASVRDLHWDEFLKRWYTNPLPPTVGEWCRYMPPAVVLSDTVSGMALEVTSAEGTGALLTWPAVPGAVEYMILAQNTATLGWRLQSIVPAPTTTSAETALASPVRFRVAALDENGAIIALSAAAIWRAEVRLYLPLIQRD